MIRTPLIDLARAARDIVLTPLLSPTLRDELLRWHRSKLYWEGVTHPDGGDREDGANIELAEGGIIAVRRLADRLGLSPASLPDDPEARRLSRITLQLTLDAEESAAVNALARLGPSACIPITRRMDDHRAASEAEDTLEHSERIREYSRGLMGSATPRAAPGPSATTDTPEIRHGRSAVKAKCSRYPDPVNDPPEACLTHPDFLPTEDKLTAVNAGPHFLLASYTADNPETLANVFLQRLRVPMTVDSERAGMEIELPDLASIHRWAATEFDQYEMGQL